MASRERTRILTTIARNLGIASSSPLHRQVEQFLMYVHPERLRQITVQFSQERNRALSKTAGQRSDRDQALMDPERIWKMVVSEYNHELRQYGFLYIVFNLLEDTVRAAVDEHYCARYGENWHQDTSRWPVWVFDELNRKNKVALHQGMGSRTFMEKQTIGSTVAFLVTRDAWTVHDTRSLFTGKVDRASGTLLTNLSRCEVYERLVILQQRRNAVYHHEPLPNPYPVPDESRTVPGGCTPRQQRYTDGTIFNTVERLFEILRYFGLKPEMVMHRMVGSSRTLPHLRNLPITPSLSDIQDSF